jgi:hypothetical protein
MLLTKKFFDLDEDNNLFDYHLSYINWSLYGCFKYEDSLSCFYHRVYGLGTVRLESQPAGEKSIQEKASGADVYELYET